MTVEELIEQLKALPPHSPVLVEGYESGYDGIVALESQEVCRYRNAQEWDGEYRARGDFSGKESKTEPAVVIIGRRGRLR